MPRLHLLHLYRGTGGQMDIPITPRARNDGVQKPHIQHLLNQLHIVHLQDRVETWQKKCLTTVLVLPQGHVAPRVADILGRKSHQKNPAEEENETDFHSQ